MIEWGKIWFSKKLNLHFKKPWHKVLDRNTEQG
jgi:hypothetical protein